ncbi:hypothetical protein [Ferrimonas balearica]|uniref:hypothetical protein n=1 Tax=Ferrimonas balearica TaxID=44012 RepID=UPI001F33F63B|nr:hypothetical protein [Ferrimonas balearica]MBY6093818.1 hypothetical protein [Ferrimonas balearica]
MSGAYSITGFYGRGTVAEIYCVPVLGGTWYALEGSRNVNLCDSLALSQGVDVEQIADFDTFQADAPIHSIGDLLSELG